MVVTDQPTGKEEEKQNANNNNNQNNSPTKVVVESIPDNSDLFADEWPFEALCEELQHKLFE